MGGKGKRNKYQHFGFLLHKHFTISGLIQNLKILTLKASGENEQIKGMIYMRMLILSSTIQQVESNVCTNF